MNESKFSAIFEALTGNAPFPWQKEMYSRLGAGDIPGSCNLPTGLGKTSVIAIWLIALATGGRTVPRRLVYVVNRRTVVDQSTEETIRFRNRLLAPDRPALLTQLAEALTSLAADPAGGPFAISTLRGQFADNGEWWKDPARPAVVVGTVDMIGSRLLFSGYGCGFKTRPLHAGFLGQDVLLVHDEAHLEPAFQDLLIAIRDQQADSPEFRRFSVMELTATSRSREGQFGLTPADLQNEIVQRRIEAKKRLALHPLEDEKKTADRVAQLALEKDFGQAVLVFLRKLEDVQAVAKRLPQATRFLTGTLRGHERDRLATEDPIFARFLRPSDRQAKTVADGTVYLVCTSAGEVGVNISADHLVCDLTPFDSMAQRFGRVNRFGEGDAQVEVVHPTRFDQDEGYEARRQKTLSLLTELDGNASPSALRNMRGRADLPCQLEDAFTPLPTILPTSDVLFDAWTLTTVRERLPGRPAVSPWLHGVTDRDLPETRVAWRQEVDAFRRHVERIESDEERRRFEKIVAALLDDFPLKPHELLRDRTDRVFKELAKLAAPINTPVWLVAADDSVRVTTLGTVIEADKEELNGQTVLLPPSAGGLRIEGGRSSGWLDGTAEYDAGRHGLYDIADEWWTDEDPPRRRRERRWDEERPEGMRLERTVEFATSGDEEEAEGDDQPGSRVWRWYVRPRSADDGKEWSATGEQHLADHLRDAGQIAERIAEAVCLPEPLRKAVVFAARHHDYGKHRTLWQMAIGNCDYPSKVLAKSGHSRPPENLSAYRHEFGSLLDVVAVEEFKRLPADVQDLVLHLIAAHHGRARPHFPPAEAYDPERREAAVVEVAREVPRRFGRLQRKYGRWGLAYLESLVRAADVLASTAPQEGS